MISKEHVNPAATAMETWWNVPTHAQGPEGSQANSNSASASASTDHLQTMDWGESTDELVLGDKVSQGLALNAFYTTVEPSHANRVIAADRHEQQQGTVDPHSSCCCTPRFENSRHRQAATSAHGAV